MGITTLDGDRNWVSQLDNYKRADGHDIFKFIRHGPCETCVGEGRGAKCPHFERAPWKSKVIYVLCKCSFRVLFARVHIIANNESHTSTRIASHF